MNIDRKNTPKMAVRALHSEFERLEREARNQERFTMTIAIVGAFIIIVLLAELAAS